MYHKILSIIALAATTAVSAQAQSAATIKPVTFGVKAGAAIPLGDFSSGYDLGFILGGQATIATRNLPFNLRFDADYSRYGAKGNENANARILGFTGAALYNFPTRTSFSFYGLGGLGLYNVKASYDDGTTTVSRSENDFGLNAGLGMRIPSSNLNMFVETRFHWIFKSGDSAHLIPITFGINF